MDVNPHSEVTEPVMNDHLFPQIEVSGTSYDMGYQHGAQARDMIRRYIRMIELMTQKPYDMLCAGALKFLPYFESVSPAYVEEIRGLAQGADITFEEAMLCQVRGEAVAMGDYGCTAFAVKGAVTRDGATLIGQNQDLPPEYADVAVLLHVKPSDGRPRAFMFTFAGQLGFTGMNSNGVAHMLNMLYDFRWRPAVNHYPLKRIMLERRTVDECIELFRATPVCSARNHLVCDGSGGIADIEVRPDAIAVYPGGNPDCIVHANHYSSDEFSHLGTDLPDSKPRMARMQALIDGYQGVITVDTMKTILADHEGYPHGICRHGSDMRSIAGFIAEPMRGRFHVRRGHGCLGHWEVYEV